MTTQPELAELIEKGYSFPNVKEARFVFLYYYSEEGVCRACPIGAAFIGKTGNPEEAFKKYLAADFSNIFLSDELKISRELWKNISNDHFDEAYSVKEIVELLKLDSFPE
jgi:hypothetical protein